MNNSITAFPIIFRMILVVQIAQANILIARHVADNSSVPVEASADNTASDDLASRNCSWACNPYQNSTNRGTWYYRSTATCPENQCQFLNYPPGSGNQRSGPPRAGSECNFVIPRPPNNQTDLSAFVANTGLGTCPSR